MKIDDSVEFLHQRLEARPDLAEVDLCLNDRRHVIFLPDSGEINEEDERYILQRVSALRWIEGPGELSADSVAVQRVIDEAYAEGGELSFEATLFSKLSTSPSPADQAGGDGRCQLFIDIGGSSVKGAFFSNEQLCQQLSKGWTPFKFRSMVELTKALTRFLTELIGDRSTGSFSHVGISCAGLCRKGALLVSSLTQGISFSDTCPYDPWFLKKLIYSQFPQASYQLLNDGAVTALPHRDKSPFGKQCVISLVMGSNLGGGYYSPTPSDAVHEIGFIPCLHDSGWRDQWSGYDGIGSEIFSKKGLFRLAAEHGYHVSDKMTEREVIDQLHTDLRHGLTKARVIFQQMGRLFGPFVIYLQRYYTIDEVLLSGGILTAAVVDEMRGAYEESYNDLSENSAPALRMLIVPGVLPEYNQVWSLALNYFATKS